MVEELTTSGNRIVKENETISGSNISNIDMFETIKGIMIDFLRGYPLYIFWGIIELRFNDIEKGNKVRDKLEADGLIKKITPKVLDSISPEKLEKMPPLRKDRLNSYSLTPEGVNFAVSLNNLNYSEKIAKYSEDVLNYNKEVLGYTRETQEFNRRIIKLTILLVIIGIMAIIVGIIPILPNLLNAFRSLF